MAGGVSLSTISNVVKTLYRDDLFNKLLYKKRPAFGMLKKFEGFGGKNMPVPLIYGDSHAVSSTFSTAQALLSETTAGTSAPANAQFLAYRSKKYAFAKVDRETMLATKSDNMAFVQALKQAIDSAINGISNAIETQLFDSGEGILAQIAAAGVTGSVITLAQPEEICRFEVGMSVLADDTKAGSSATMAANAVAAVNRVDGKITMTTISSAAASEYLIRSGDQGALSATAPVNINGLDFWLGGTTYFGTTNTSKMGLDTSTDSRLAGLTYDGSSLSITDALLDAAHIAGREEGDPDIAILNHAHYRKLIKEREGIKYEIVANATSAKSLLSTIGYEGIVVQGNGGTIKVMPANKCQGTRGYVLSKDTWTLASLGPAVAMVDEDGKSMLRISNDDSFEIRLAFYGNLVCNAPGYNVKLTLATP